MIEGELTLWVGGETIVAPAGSFVFGPKGIPHTFIVSSEEARFLLVTEPAGFEQFMRAVGEPAARLEIPPPATEPPDVAALTAAAAEFGIEITGPPGIPGLARPAPPARRAHLPRRRVRERQDERAVGADAAASPDQGFDPDRGSLREGAAEPRAERRATWPPVSSASP